MVLVQYKHLDRPASPSQDVKRISAVFNFHDERLHKAVFERESAGGLLESRGLVVTDREAAAQFLSRVNYYRLSGYAIPFLTDREHFMPGATFDDLVAVYRFDRELRVLRNFCAHHTRLVGRRFYGYSPFVDWPKSAATIDTRKLFHQFLFAYRMLKGVPDVCFGRDNWKRRVCDMLACAPQSPCFDLAALMGVPSDAATSQLWK